MRASPTTRIRGTFHLATLYLARGGGYLFMSGVKGDAFDPTETGGTLYQNLLYALPADGSCASQSCATAVVSLPSSINWCVLDSCSGEVRAIQTTSLATGVVNGAAGPQPYLAVGLSDGGVQIYAISPQGGLRLTSTSGGWPSATGHRRR